MKCREKVKCNICNSVNHPTALHVDSQQTQRKRVVDNSHPATVHEGEPSPSVTTLCTEVCGNRQTRKSCAKISLVRVYPAHDKASARALYCMIEDQSSHTLAVSDFLDSFNENGPETTYSLESCSGLFNASGRTCSGYIIEALDGSTTFHLPTVLECDDIPQNRDEIPSPDIMRQHSHLRDLSGFIPHIDDSNRIELLIGRDLINAHIVLEHGIGVPYAQKLPLGWVLIGDTCLGKAHLPMTPITVDVRKTSVLPNGRPSLFDPCEKTFTVKDDKLFQRTLHDEKPGLSVEDRKFLAIMESGFTMSDDGKWTAPLPFRQPRPILDNNRALALKRAVSFDRNLHMNEKKASHVFKFMGKLLGRGYAERAQDPEPNEEVWYIALFGVYHPKKPESIRVVFDSRNFMVPH